ncbi:hypothetical protein ACHAWC_009328 [Mediolabrus comicus]
MKQPIIIAPILVAAAIGPAAIAFQLQHPAASFLCDRSSRTELLSSSPSIDTETNNDGSNSSGGRSIYDDIDSFQRDSRAGEDGYSVLRRPVTFDADVDPSFDAPLVLDEKEEEKLMDANKNWYEERSGEGRRSGNGRKKGQSSKNSVLGEYADVLQVSNDDKNNNNLHTTRQNEEDQHLDMFQRTLETLDYPLVLRALANECETMKGKEIVMSSHSHGGKGVVDNSNNDDDDIATMPLTASSVTGVHQRFGAVQEMQRLMEGRVSGWVTSSREQQQGKKKAVRKPLGAPPIGGHTFDLQPIFDIVDEGKVLEGPEILDIQTMLEVSFDVLDWARALKEFNNDLESDNNVDLQPDPFIELPRLTQSISIDDELYHLLTNAFDDDGKLSGTTFPGIGRLRAKVRTYKRDILSSIESILSLPSMKNKLAVESGGSLTMEINGRLVIPVQQSYSNSVGIVHDASRSGKTAYVEPSEIVGPTNELRQAEAELRSEEARVWRQLTEMVVKHREEIERNVASIGQLDLTMARVKLGKRLSGVVPTVAEDGVVSVKEARHPILLLRGLEGVVGSDIDIGEGNNQGLILTGPNSGGKTIVLKLLGLFSFMVRDGIPVPCKSSEPARVDFFSPVLADIGDIQSVDSDLSTFSGHMLVVREVLNNADKNALVLMDEPGSGTDPNQGVAIAQSLLEALLDRGCRVAITTHYLELKQLSSTDDRFAVAGMQFKNGKPTYKLLPGVIDSETRQMGELIRDLEDQKVCLAEKAEELRKRDFEMRELKADMKRQQERLEAKQLNARREEAKKFSAKLEEKEKLLEDILERLKGSGASKKVIADSWSDIRIVKREALAEAENVSGGVMNRLRQQQSEAEEIELIPISEMSGINKVNVDDEVVVCKKGAFYGKSGTVKQVGKKIQVAVGGVPARTNNNPTMSKMAQRALELDSSADSPIDMSPNASPRDKGSTMKTKANTVDCIGKNFEESKRLALSAFSNAAMSNRSVVYILHGHGTGVLKKKIREWLKSDRQWVKNFRPADQEDGGDALTRVELKKQDLF